MPLRKSARASCAPCFLPDCAGIALGYVPEAPVD
jgi:hypothetical protein